MAELIDGDLTEQIIGAAIKVHKALGPGLLESACEACLAYELGKGGITVQRQVILPVKYEDVAIDAGFRIDLLVEGRVVVELKVVEKVLPVHEAQLMTYLRLSGLRAGPLINFDVTVLRHGIVRRVL